MHPAEGSSSEENSVANDTLAPVMGDEEIHMDSFKLWCLGKELKADVIAQLEDQGFDSVLSLSLMIQEDIDELAIAQRAQIRLLQAAVKLAKQEIEGTPPGGADKGATSAPTPSSSASPAVHRSVPQNNPNLGFNIDSLLKGLPSQVDAPIPTPANFSRTEFDPEFHLLAGKTGTGASKPLDILDFVGMSIKVDQVDEHIVSELGDNHTFVLKSGPKKPKYDSLTVWQWCLGAIRIQHELTRLGRLTSDKDKRQYWGYICKILELNSRFEWQSVLEFDKEYRGHQARFNFAWGTEIPHLSSVQLRDKKLSFQNNANKNKKSTQSGNGGNKKGSFQKCRDFNRDKCTHNPCIYKHICSVDGCGKNHPAFKHDAESKN